MRFSEIFSAAAILCTGAAFALPLSDCGSEIEARSLGTSMNIEARGRPELSEDMAKCNVCKRKVYDPEGLFSYCKNSNTSHPHASCQECLKEAFEHHMDPDNPICPEPGCDQELDIENAIAYICPSSQASKSQGKKPSNAPH